MALRTLMDGRLKVTILTTNPNEDPLDGAAIPLATLSAGIDATCDLAKAGTRFSATASDTIADGRLCDEANTNALGASNYEAAMAVFWLLDEDGSYDPLDNPTFEAIREKGATVWVVLREGPSAKTDWASGDAYELWEFVSDNPQRPTETSGYIKRIVPGQGQKLLDGVVAA